MSRLTAIGCDDAWFKRHHAPELSDGMMMVRTILTMR